MAQLLAALGIVFVAELGDKTQLVALGLGARHRLGPVLAGVALAYAATTFLSVVAGGLLGAALPERAIGIGGGILFLAFAGWTLRHPGEVPGEDGEPGEDGAEGAEGEGDATSPEPAARPTAVLVASVAGAMFVAELGDKTMLATATLASRGNPVMVWIGAAAGIFLAGAAGVVLGHLLGRRLPERATARASAALFAVFGVALIVTSW